MLTKPKQSHLLKEDKLEMKKAVIAQKNTNNLQLLMLGVRSTLLPRFK